MAEFKRIINVIPLININLGSSQIFTYLVPTQYHEQMRSGQLVIVPFGSRRIFGITSSQEAHRLQREVGSLKEVELLVDLKPYLSLKNFELARWLAENCVAPLGVVIKAMLPRPAKKSKPPQNPGLERFDPDFILNEHQRRAVTAVSNALDTEKTFLLHGVTGSGKTEVYMRIIKRVIGKDAQTILLVPEISLTPQAIERFGRRFGMEEVAVLHSRLGARERLWMWERIRDGDKKIIIGPRSAIFAPVKKLGLIIIDEEHDPSYKQYDQKPKYHARDVARQLSRLWECPLLLGDATPSVESYFELKTKDPGALLPLPHRIKADIGLPKIKVVDMRQELKARNFSIFSDKLNEELLRTLNSGKQVLLFLNRRGSATAMLCRDCGFVLTCDNCSIALVWHMSRKKLLCHHCGKTDSIQKTCPNCQGTNIKAFGAGTQRVEAEIIALLKEHYPADKLPRIERMDKDSTTKKGSGSKLYQDWVDGKIQVLVGTQMISKGWDVANVGLVGVISADGMLHFPDFRANERTFQLLTQVSGRTGRGADQGLVVLQTFHPDNPAISAARHHDFEEFFQHEIAQRKTFNFPPYVDIVKLTISSTSTEKAQAIASDTQKQLLKNRSFPVEILGPIPAFFEKINGKYRYQILLKIPQKDSKQTYEYLQYLPRGVDIDINPSSLL